MSTTQRIRQLITKFRKRTDEEYARRISGAEKLFYLAAKAGRPLTRPTTKLQACITALRTYGSTVKEATGVPLTQQFAQQLEGAIRCGLPPKAYYLYAIYNDVERMGEYIPQDDWWQLLDRLLTAQETDEGALLDDKRKGEAHFVEHGLPTIRSLAVIEDGHIQPRRWGGQSPLPAQDLFSKPVDAAFGKGARRWHIQPNGRYRAEDGSVVSQDELLDQLKRQSEARPILLQPLVSNHDRLRILMGDTLVSLRIITMRRPRAEARYLIGYISLPIGDVIGSNARFGVLRAPIEEATGRLGAAYDRNDIARTAEPIPVHPATGERIGGFQLPLWEEIVDLALQAHDTLPTIALVGWDIALTPGGPVIIEGNSTPGANSPQITHKMPWGATDFPELYIANLECATRPSRENPSRCYDHRFSKST